MEACSRALSGGGAFLYPLVVLASFGLGVLGVGVAEDVFRSVLRSRVFADRGKLRHDYVPEHLPHREGEVKRVASALAPALRGEKPSNVLVYGPPGTGKTAVVRHVLSKLEATRAGVRVKGVYVNAEHAGTPYRVAVEVGEALGARMPFTGLSVGEVFDRIARVASQEGATYIVVLDEVDSLARKRGGAEVIHMLARVGEKLKTSKVSLVGVAGTSSPDDLGSGVRASLGEVEVSFPPYTGDQLRGILAVRAREAFNPGVLEGDVIPLCADTAYKVGGYARTAIDLLRAAGEVAERLGSSKVTSSHVYIAWEEVERDRVADAVRALPLHSKLILASVLETTRAGKTTTGEVYRSYKQIASELGLKPVTLRRVSGILAELNRAGVIAGEVVSMGRHGKTRIIQLAVDRKALYKALSEDITLGELVDTVEEKRG